MQCCPRGSRQHCTRKNSVIILMKVKTLYSAVGGAPDIFAQKKILCNVVSILLEQYCTGKTQCNVVLEAPDNNAQEKILFNVALIFLREYCTGQNPMHCCRWNFRQHCIGKNSVQYCLNTPGSTLLRKTLFVVTQEAPDNLPQAKI